MAHLVHEMKSTRVPRRFVFFDTETVTRKEHGADVQRWRCGVTSEVHWQSKESQWSRPVVTEHTTQASLWAAILEAARVDTRTVVVAHNLSFDLRIADAFSFLPRLGWSIEKLTMSPFNVGFDAVKDRRRLVFVDSVSTLPTSIERLGNELEMTKPALPASDDSMATWLERCTADVAILQTAYLVIIDALRKGDLGCWSRTGAGMAWNTFIRRHLADKVLVHGDDALRDIEAQANYGGRNEVWKWGRLKGGPWVEWDAELAYANVLASEKLPAYYVGQSWGVKLSHVRRTYPDSRWLIEADIETDVPVLPMRDEHGSVYPTGTFSGWWWDVELLAAEDAGARVTIRTAHRYRGVDWMATWANWVIDAVADRDTAEARIFGIAAKHWQRAIVGRSAMRYRAWEEAGPAFLHGVSYMPMLDNETKTLGAVFQAGGMRWEAWERVWWDQALPQLLSAVTAHCRVNLWRAMNVAGLEHVAYVDTDSAIVDPEGAKRLKAAAERGELGSLRAKSTLRRLDVWAPRYVTSPTLTKIAGVGSDRTLIGEHRYASTAWERITAALSNGRGDQVATSQVVSQLSTEDWHRLHLDGGQTAAYVVEGGVRVDAAVLAEAG